MEEREWDEEEDPIETPCDQYGHDPVPDKEDPDISYCSRCGESCI